MTGLFTFQLSVSARGCSLSRLVTRLSRFYKYLVHEAYCKSDCLPRYITNLLDCVWNVVWYRTVAFSHTFLLCNYFAQKVLYCMLQKGAKVEKKCNGKGSRWKKSRNGKGPRWKNSCYGKGPRWKIMLWKRWWPVQVQAIVQRRL